MFLGNVYTGTVDGKLWKIAPNDSLTIITQMGQDLPECGSCFLFCVCSGTTSSFLFLTNSLLSHNNMTWCWHHSTGYTRYVGALKGLWRWLMCSVLGFYPLFVLLEPRLNHMNQSFSCKTLFKISWDENL